MAFAERIATPWASLDRRQVVELTLPGVLIGLLTGAIAGGLAAAVGLSLGTALVAFFSLGVPLALAGALYEILLAQGRLPVGPLAPVALVLCVAFPLARALNAAVVDLYAGAPVAVPHGWLDFVVYQMLVSVGFAIGFWWLHENFAPRWWFHLRDRNPVAEHFIRTQLQVTGEVQRSKQRREARRRARATGGR